MSVSSIPEKVKVRLWSKSAGRCQYPGCNRILWKDELTQKEMNQAFIAHIIADKPNGPRGDRDLSKKLSKNIDNLMLLCDTHHRLIDREEVEFHTVELLRNYKKEHEERIEQVTGIVSEKSTHVLLYGANIGKHCSPLSKEKAYHAVVKNGYYPAESNPIELSLKNSSIQDHEKSYWEIEKENLTRLFEQKVKSRLCNGSINHLSLFGIAPQPLLIYLGHLLSDLPSAEIYQLHRSPPDWVWRDNLKKSAYITEEKGKEGKKIVLIISLSQKINIDEVYKVLDKKVTVWMLFIDHPHNEFIENKGQLTEFKIEIKKVLSNIKEKHGSNDIIYLFPAVPASIAIEIGRARIPKVDNPLVIYDYNKKCDGFIKTIWIE